MAETRELTNALLKEVQTDAILKRGRTSDCNNATQSGYYRCENNCINSPSNNAGILKVYSVGDGGECIAIQEYMDIECNFSIRLSWATGGFRWSPWKNL